MLNFLKRLLGWQDKCFGAIRSPKWKKFREDFLKGKVCAVCGGVKKLELHHKQAFSTNPELELEKTNVIPLCESGKYGIVCHQFVGHLGDYKRINPDVENDALIWSYKLKRSQGKILDR